MTDEFWVFLRLSLINILDILQHPNKSMQIYINLCISTGLTFGQKYLYHVEVTKLKNNIRGHKYNKKGLSSFLKSFIPEAIYRTMKLEGEKVSRKLIERLIPSANN